MDSGTMQERNHERSAGVDCLITCEARISDHYRETAAIDAAGWRKPARTARYHVTLAQLLVALATRIAPTVTMPSANAQAPAQ